MIKRNSLLVFLTTGLLLTGCDYPAYHGYQDGATGVATYETHPHYAPAPPASSLPTAPSYSPPGGTAASGPSYAPPAASRGNDALTSAPARGGPSYGY